MNKAQLSEVVGVKTILRSHMVLSTVVYKKTWLASPLLQATALDAFQRKKYKKVVRLPKELSNNLEVSKIILTFGP